MKNGTFVTIIGTVICISIMLIFFFLKSGSVYIPGLNYELFNRDDYAGQTILLDLNNATIDQLDDIPGIKLSLAKEIVGYRERYGKYVDTDELLDVSGMTMELYTQIKSYVCVGGS